MRIPTRATMSVVLAGALVAACSGAAAPQAPAADLAAALAVAGSSLGDPGGRDARTHPEDITPTPTPLPTTDGQGAEVVRGLEVFGGTFEDVHDHEGR